jgi:hypothetical protein
MTGVTSFVCVVFALTALQGPQGGPPRDTDVPPTTGTASLAGVVVNDETPPRPVRRAIVTVAGPALSASGGAPPWLVSFVMSKARQSRASRSARSRHGHRRSGRS